MMQTINYINTVARKARGLRARCRGQARVAAPRGPGAQPQPHPWRQGRRFWNGDDDYDDDDDDDDDCNANNDDDDDDYDDTCNGKKGW